MAEIRYTITGPTMCLIMKCWEKCRNYQHRDPVSGVVTVCDWPLNCEHRYEFEKQSNEA